LAVCTWFSGRSDFFRRLIGLVITSFYRRANPH
jgi:hypothetical protein